MTSFSDVSLLGICEHRHPACHDICLPSGPIRSMVLQVVSSETDAINFGAAKVIASHPLCCTGAKMCTHMFWALGSGQVHGVTWSLCRRLRATNVYCIYGVYALQHYISMCDWHGHASPAGICLAAGRSSTPCKQLAEPGLLCVHLSD